MTIQALITVVILAGAAGWAVLIAVRAMRRDIAADAGVIEDWSGAQRYGGGFGAAGQPPPEEIIRETWTPVRPAASGPLSRASADGLNANSGKATLERFATWCDSKCRGGWVLSVTEATPITVWFDRADDAERFTAAWLPVRAT